MFSKDPPRYRILREQLVPAARDEVFTFFADARNLEKLTPPFLRFRILTPTPIDMHIGTRILYSIALFGIPMKWQTHITDWQPEVSFLDEQESGPYAIWRHAHEFATHVNGTLIRDQVEYALPLGPLGRIAHALFVSRMLKKIFDFRQDAVVRIFGTVVEVNQHD